MKLSYETDMTTNHVESEKMEEDVNLDNAQKIMNNGRATITRYIHIKHADSSVRIFRETTV